MNAYDSLPDAVTEIFGEEATAELAYDLLTVDVPVGSWIAGLEIARDKLGCTYFDWLSAVDEPGTGFRVCAHVAALEGGHVRRLMLRTTVPHEAPALPSAIDIYAGAAWHERETYEMFGVTFTDHPHLVPLLLPDGFEGHPLRKDFVLAARVAKAWPGAKEPGESEHGGPKRRQMLPPGVPDPNEWGPLKGQLPPAPARPARTPRAAGERPVRRVRTVSEGSASQEAAPATEAPTTPPVTGDRPPRRSRSASEGSASQATGATTTPATAPAAEPDTAEPTELTESTGARAVRPPRRARSASEGSATQRDEPTATPDAPAPDEGAGPANGQSAAAAEPPAQQADAPREAPAQAPAPRTRSADAPWHHARPAFDDAADSGATEADRTEAGATDSAPAETGTTDGHAKESGTGSGSGGSGTESGSGGSGTGGSDSNAETGTSDTEAHTPSDTSPTPRPKTGSPDGPDTEPTEPAGGDPA